MAAGNGRRRPVATPSRIFGSSILSPSRRSLTRVENLFAPMCPSSRLAEIDTSMRRGAWMLKSRQKREFVSASTILSPSSITPVRARLRLTCTGGLQARHEAQLTAPERRRKNYQQCEQFQSAEEHRDRAYPSLKIIEHCIGRGRPHLI